MILNIDRLNKLNNIFNSCLNDKHYNIIFYMVNCEKPIEKRVHRNEIFDTVIKNVSNKTVHFTICDDIDFNFILSVKELFNGKLEIIL